MIDLDDVKNHLAAAREDGERLLWDDDTISAVLRAEHAAQRSVCDIPSSGRTEALDTALLRRVAVNLEQTGGEPLVRVGSTDAEVRELEKPHSKRRAPERDEAPTNGGRRKGRSTSKKTQSRKD